MEHHHEHKVRGKNLVLTILLNVIITVAEAIGGFITGSMALLSDASHNLSDVISLIVTYAANRLSLRKATEKETFGFKRSEIIAAFINSSTLIVLAILILVEAIKRIAIPEPVSANWVIYLAILSIVINGLSVLLIVKDVHGNMNVKSAFLHLFSDMLTSIGVLISGLAMKYFQWFWIDSLISVAIAVYLIFMSWNILVNSLKILMQFTPDNLEFDKITDDIQQIEGIRNIHHIHIWKLDEHQIMLEAHIDLNNDVKITEFETILNNISTCLKKYDIYHYTIQPEFSVDDNKQKIYR